MQDQFKTILEKVEAIKKANPMDLSTDEDLAVAVMNLVSLEEHFFFTRMKTGKDEYLDLMQEVREVRKAMLGKLIDKSKMEGETWCISKHLLATTMRLIEVGTKLQGDNKKEEAKDVFDRAERMFTLFWGIRLNLLSTKDLKEEAGKEKPWGLQDIVGKLVDCCNE